MVFSIMLVSTQFIIRKHSKTRMKLEIGSILMKKYQHGVKLWANAPSLPELNFEYEPVKNFIYKDKSSVLKTYLNMGIDGFRLDVAFDLGYDILKEITQSAHQENAFSLYSG